MTSATKLIDSPLTIAFMTVSTLRSSANIARILTCSRSSELKVDTSPNVHVEDLHNTRQLDTTYYVTDSTQASDFFFDRDSGLRVNVGISSVQLIPEYVDVDHQSDNNYMLTDPNSSEDRPKFRAVMRDYCR